MRPTFTIVWVEDKPRAMQSQVDTIKEYLEEKNFYPNIIHDEDGSQFKRAIKDRITIDIVVTDKNLTGAMDGLQVVKILKAQRKLTDVLFYSARGFNHDEVRNEHYGFIDIVEGKQITDELKRLIDKNLKRCDDIVYMRGMIISMIIDFEMKVNEFFAGYFEIPQKHMEHFHNFMLENKYNSLAGRKTTLMRILKKNKIDKDFYGLSTAIDKLGEDRNLLAHCRTHASRKNVLVCMGDDEEFDRARLNGILDRLNKACEYLEDLIQKYRTV